MQSRSILFLFILILICLAAAGCASQASVPQPAPPASPVTTLSPAACQLQPGATQAVPGYEAISITVDRNTITVNPAITVRFNGGLGNGMVQTMTATVIRADCVTEQDHRDNPVVGSSITLMGATQTDRMIVDVVMTSGEKYTVIDQLYTFPPIVLLFFSDPSVLQKWSTDGTGAQKPDRIPDHRI